MQREQRPLSSRSCMLSGRILNASSLGSLFFFHCLVRDPAKTHVLGFSCTVLGPELSGGKNFQTLAALDKRTRFDRLAQTSNRAQIVLRHLRGKQSTEQSSCCFTFIVSGKHSTALHTLSSRHWLLSELPSVSLPTLSRELKTIHRAQFVLPHLSHKGGKQSADIHTFAPSAVADQRTRIDELV